MVRSDQRLLGRRQLLLAGLGMLALGRAGASVEKDWRVQLLLRDRHLNMRRRDTGEEAKLCYWRAASGWDFDGYDMACYLLRDVRYNAMVRMDSALLDTLCIIQAWLDAYDAPSKIHILSGYRTKAHNDQLEGAAKNSLHTQGMAADIYIPGISATTLGKMGQMLSVGGVGFYPSRGFVHIDVGRIRSWKG